MQLALFTAPPPEPPPARTHTTAHAVLQYEYKGQDGSWMPAECTGLGTDSKAALMDCRRKADHLGTWRPVGFETAADGAEGPAGWIWNVDDKHNPRPEWLRWEMG